MRCDPDLASEAYFKWPCGCWYYRKSPDELRLQVCSQCYELSLELLTTEVLDKQSVLELPLA